MFYLTKDGIFFLLFCPTNPALILLYSWKTTAIGNKKGEKAIGFWGEKLKTMFT
jgi:hypothetical protein